MYDFFDVWFIENESEAECHFREGNLSKGGKVHYLYVTKSACYLKLYLKYQQYLSFNTSYAIGHERKYD